MRAAMSGVWFYKVAYCLLIVFVLGGLVFVGESKIVVFILLSLLLYVFRISEFSFLRLVFMILAALVFVLALVQVVQHTYWKVGSNAESPPSSNYSKIFLGKGVLRQAATGYCLSNVLKTHSKDQFEISKQAFWIEGLIPRVLWDNKPSLSLGGTYAVNYCSKLPEYLGHHSASITLLGQPVIQGGMIGLILHGGILLMVLATIEKMNSNRTGLSTAFVVAMLPWLIDFDQDFAMYVANAVKFALVMTILFIPIYLIERKEGEL